MKSSTWTPLSPGSGTSNLPAQDALEVRVCWGNTILDQAHFYAPTPVTLGSAEKDTFCVNTEALGDESFLLIEPEGKRLYVHFHDRMQGQLVVGDKTLSLAQLKQHPRCSPTETGYRFSLPTRCQLQLRLADYTIEIGMIEAPKKLSGTLMQQVDRHFSRALGISFVVHGFVILFMLFSDEAPQGLGDTFMQQQQRISQLLMREEPTPPPRKINKQAAAKAKGKEGKMGERDSKVKHQQKSGSIKASEKPNSLINASKLEKSIVKKIRGLGLLGAMDDTMKSVLKQDGLGGADADAKGSWFGTRVGSSRGMDGLGLRGSGKSGGGLDGDVVGLGGVRTYGPPGGTWKGRLFKPSEGKKRKVLLTAEVGKPVLVGQYPKEIIRRVIQQHRAQIRYCYERQLIRHRKLRGKIKVFFKIEKSGRTSSAKIAQSTMNNDLVEECIVRRIRYWRFPKPKGAGNIHVYYPFFFRPSSR